MVARAVPAASSDQRLALVNPRRAARPLATGVCRALARSSSSSTSSPPAPRRTMPSVSAPLANVNSSKPSGGVTRLRIHLGAEHDGQARRAPAGQVLDAQVERELRHGDERRGGRAQHRLHERHAELLDLEPPGCELGRGIALGGPAHDHLVGAELGALRDGPRALGDAARVPGERQLVLLVAAEMPDDEAAGPLRGGDRAEAARHRAADHVLHAAPSRPRERARGRGWCARWPAPRSPSWAAGSARARCPDPSSSARRPGRRRSAR